MHIMKHFLGSTVFTISFTIPQVCTSHPEVAEHLKWDSLKVMLLETIRNDDF